MSNALQQQPGTSFQGNFSSSQPSGFLSAAAAIGTANTHTSTTVDTFGGGISTITANKGSLIALGAGGHTPDVLGAAAAAASSITLATATTTTATGTALRVYNNPGLIVATDVSALTNGSTTTSAYYVGSSGTAGVVNQNDLSNSIYGDIFFIAGAAFTPTAGGFLAGWLLETDDQGYTFERTVASTSVPRAPDFIIPLFASAYAQGDRAWAKGVIFPSAPFKTFLQNQSGATMPATWGIWAAPEGMQLAT